MKQKTKYIVYFLGICGALLCCVGWMFQKLSTQPNAIHLQAPATFQIDHHTSARSFVHFLKQQNLIHSELTWLVWLRLHALSTQLKAGVYQIQPGESAEHLLQRVVQGDVLKQRFSIIEGTTWLQIQANLSKAPYLIFKPEDIADVNAKKLQITDSNVVQPSARQVSLDQRSEPILEGLFLADTYQYAAGNSAKAMLLSAHQHLNNYVLQIWAERALDLPYHTPYELLIVASILEKESAISAERRLISGVIVNRLAKHMPLQMDPTVIYGLHFRYTGILSHEDLQDDSPYNTYHHRGLPPTPIAMVGRDAIDAAAHPTITNYLYFVAKGDGTHVFSETYEAQRQAIRRYMRKNP